MQQVHMSLCVIHFWSQMTGVPFPTCREREMLHVACYKVGIHFPEIGFENSTWSNLNTAGSYSPWCHSLPWSRSTDGYPYPCRQEKGKMLHLSWYKMGLYFSKNRFFELHLNFRRGRGKALRHQHKLLPRGVRHHGELGLRGPDQLSQVLSPKGVSRLEWRAEQRNQVGLSGWGQFGKIFIWRQKPSPARLRAGTAPRPAPA